MKTYLVNQSWRCKCSSTSVCVFVLCCVPKETVKVHSQYHRNPPVGLATKERRCPGRKIKRGRCAEILKDGWGKRQWWEDKRKYMRRSGKVESVCIHIWPILPQALQRLCLAYNTSGNESESWRVPPALLSPQSPPNQFCWFLLFSLSSFLSAFIFFIHLSPPFRLLAHKTWQRLSGWPLLDTGSTSFVLFRLKQDATPFLIVHISIIPIVYLKCKNNISYTNNAKQETTKLKVGQCLTAVWVIWKSPAPAV